MLTDQQLKLLKIYDEGLALYKERKWSAARDKFLEALQALPEDGPSRLYVERCEAYMKDPPGADWDGVFVMKTK
ncbi:MAG: hypothetical protein K1X75_07055 [Leptospirales bacterium]|nr:hypothetical protein [Leptospirales bacterium]